MGMAMARVQEQRRADRVAVRLVTSHDGGNYPLTLLNLSATGMLLNCPRPLRVGATVQIDLPRIGATQAEIMWNEADEYGCRFFQPIPESVVDEAARASRRPAPRPVPRRRSAVSESPERDETRSLVVLVLFLAFVVALFFALQSFA